MINFSNINGVVNQALKPSPLGKAIGDELTRRKIQKAKNERRAERLRAAAERDQAKIAQAHKDRAKSAAQVQKVNDRQNDLWDRYKRTGKGTFNQDMLFKHGPSGPPEAPREPAPAPEQPIPHIPGQGDLFVQHEDLAPATPPGKPGDQLSLFPEPARVWPEPQETTSAARWTQGDLFETHAQAPTRGVPPAPQFSQGTLFSQQLQPHAFTNLPANPRQTQKGLFPPPEKQPRPRPAQQTPFAPAPIKRPAGRQIPLFNNQLKPYAGAPAEPTPASKAPQPEPMQHLVEQARKLSAQTWIPEGYTPPQQR